MGLFSTLQPQRIFLNRFRRVQSFVRPICSPNRPNSTKPSPAKFWGGREGQSFLKIRCYNRKIKNKIVTVVGFVSLKPIRLVSPLSSLFPFEKFHFSSPLKISLGESTVLSRSENRLKATPLQGLFLSFVRVRSCSELPRYRHEQIGRTEIDILSDRDLKNSSQS